MTNAAMDVGRPERRSAAEKLVAEMLERQLQAILAHEPGARLGADADELHDMRVAVRRARALLRTARPLLEPSWTAAVRAELAWLGRALGDVRDHDVFVARLKTGAAELEPEDRRAAKGLITRADSERDSAKKALVEALDSERYQALLRTLAEGVAALPFLPVEVDLRTLAAKEFEKLRKEMRELGPEASAERVHRARIKGKRARYAAELVAAGDGKSAARFVKRAKRFQDVTGEHQDAVVAEQRLGALAARARGTTAAFTAGRLAERESRRWRTARVELPTAWRKLERAGRKAWA